MKCFVNLYLRAFVSLVLIVVGVIWNVGMSGSHDDCVITIDSEAPTAESISDTSLLQSVIELSNRFRGIAGQQNKPDDPGDVVNRPTGPLNVPSSEGPFTTGGARGHLKPTPAKPLFKLGEHTRVDDDTSALICVYEVKINPGVLIRGESVKITFPLPGWKVPISLSPISSNTSTLPEGQSAWTGEVLDRGEVFVMLIDDSVQARLRIDNGIYRLQSMTQETGLFKVFDERRFYRASDEDAFDEDAFDEDAFDEDTSGNLMVDVMVLYTPNARKNMCWPSICSKDKAMLIRDDIKFYVSHANLDVYLLSSVSNCLASKQVKNCLRSDFLDKISCANIIEASSCFGEIISNCTSSGKNTDCFLRDVIENCLNRGNTNGLPFCFSSILNIVTCSNLNLIDVDESYLTRCLDLSKIYCRENEECISNNIVHRLRLVHDEEFEYDFTQLKNTGIEALGEILDSLEKQEDKYIKDLRDEHKADLVVLIVDNEDIEGLRDNECGVGSYPYPSGKADASRTSNKAFSIVQQGCMDELTFIHEIGHNFGLQHSYGHAHPKIKIKGGIRYAWHTIMSYGREDSSSRLPQFSNPYLVYQNRVTGDFGKKNSVKRIRSNAEQVSRYRD